MATNRTIADLLYLFRDGQAAKTITPTDFEDLIQSLHPSTGTFIDLPGSPGSLSAGRLWQNGGVVQLALGGGPAALAASFARQGAGSFTATARQRMRASRTLNGGGSFAAAASVVAAGPIPAFSDDFNSFDAQKWFVNQYDEGGGAFWSNDPVNTADVFTYSGGKLHLAILNRASGGKSFTSAISDTFNPQFNGGTAFTQQYGYWELSVAVDRYPGLLYEMDCLSAINWPPDFCLVRVWTDAANVQYVSQFTYGAPPIVDTDSNSGWDASVSHAYGMEWTASAIRFYRDRVLVGSFGNPGGAYTNGDPIYSKHFCQTDFATAAGVTVNPAGLPKYAHVDSFKIWPTRPF